MVLRVYFDPNSMDNGVYWCLRHDGIPIDDIAEEIDLHDGINVILFYNDSSEEFEFDGKLYFRPTGLLPAPQWVGEIDQTTFRRIR